MSRESDDKPVPPGARVVPLLPGALARIREELVRAVRRVCPRWLADEAEDMAQDALVRVWQAQQREPRSETGSEPLARSYLYRAAYSAVVDEIRRRRRRAEVPADGDEQLHNVAAAGDLRRDVAIGEGITRCLAQQNEDRRRAVTLHLLGHSIEATGRLLGTGTKRAENLIYRGLAHLRECLTRLGLQT